MASCEKCWADAHGPYVEDICAEYHRLIAERTGERECTPEQQAGEDATMCEICGRRTCHQYTRECMACHGNGVRASTPRGEEG